MNTILVDIKEQDLLNFTMLSNYNLSNMNEQGHKELFNKMPFTIYRKRMMGERFLTIQIPLVDFCLFLGSGLVK